jgi:hypothetical protein
MTISTSYLGSSVTADGEEVTLTRATLPGGSVRAGERTL